jgi:RimJ/RimL family protein N-acetyltransferase
MALVLPDLQLREWTKQDRRQANRWPADTNPACWYAGAAGAAQRKSWAVLVGEQTVGRLTLRGFGADGNTAVLGTYFSPDARNGISRYAYRMFLQSIPLQLGLNAVLGDIHEANKLAINVSLKSGFKVVGEEQRVCQHCGQHHRFVLVRYEV